MMRAGQKSEGMAAWLSGIGAVLAVVVAAIGIFMARDHGGGDQTQSAPQVAPQAETTDQDVAGLNLSITSLSQRVRRDEATFKAVGTVEGLDSGWTVYLVASPDPLDAHEPGWLASLPATVGDAGAWSAHLSVQPAKGVYIVRAVAAPLAGTADCPPGAVCGTSSPSCSPGTECEGGEYILAKPLPLSGLFDQSAQASQLEVVTIR